MPILKNSDFDSGAFLCRTSSVGLSLKQLAATAAIKTYQISKTAKETEQALPLENGSYYLSVKHVSVLIQPTPEVILVSFAGSNDLEDWRSNLLFRQSDRGIHQGWFNSYKLIQSQLNEILSKLLQQQSWLIFCGHSAGGALASIAATLWGRGTKATFASQKRDCPLRVGLITFAQPKVGNQAYCDCAIASVDFCDRYNHPWDIIPLLPLGKFRHYGTLHLDWHWFRPHFNLQYHAQTPS